MGFWEWVGTVVLFGLSSGTAIFLLKWWKESRDRKARKVSYHAMPLLKEADNICGAARALKMLVSRNDVAKIALPQASRFWLESVPSILNVWQANAWVLEKSKKARPFREQFPQSVQKLSQAAANWYQANEAWRRATRQVGFRTPVRDPSGQDDSPEARERHAAAQQVSDTFEAFLVDFQALHNAVQPLVREYTTPPENSRHEVK